MKLAAELGSDIPFFLAQSAAWCRGRGEIVEPASLPNSIPILLIKPPFAVHTPWAYQQWRESLEIPGVDYSAQKMPWGELVNDLERPVFQKYFQLAEWKRWLLAQSEVAGALMSGSGSTMFAVLRTKDAGMPLAKRFAAQFGQNLWFGLTETV
jgi:4-diphosphocytidyl-2-C-methyl-D-erythritol kinase